MNVLTTRELKERLNELQGQTVMLQGWIRNHRKQKNMGFIDFFDGTCFKNPQVVYDNTIEDYAAIQTLHVGAAITVTGKVVPSYKDPTTPEVQAIAIHLEATARRITRFSRSATAWSTCAKSRICARVRACFRRFSASAASQAWPFIPTSKTAATSMCIRR